MEQQPQENNTSEENVQGKTFRKGFRKCQKDDCERSTKSEDGLCCRHRENIVIGGIPKQQYMADYQVDYQRKYYRENKGLTKNKLLRYIETLQQREL